jgi:hypothetical protein
MASGYTSPVMRVRAMTRTIAGRICFNMVFLLRRGAKP